MAWPKARSILQDRCVNTTCYELCSKTLVDDATAKPNHSNNSRASILQYTVCTCCARLTGTLSSIEKATQIRATRPSAIYNRNTCFNNNVCLGVGGLFLLRFLIKQSTAAREKGKPFSLPFWRLGCSRNCAQIPHPMFSTQSVPGSCSTLQNQSDNKKYVESLTQLLWLFLKVLIISRRRKSIDVLQNVNVKKYLTIKYYYTRVTLTELQNFVITPVEYFH